MIEIRGRDLMNGVPQEILVSQRQIAESLAEPVTAIIEAVKVALEHTPPELPPTSSTRASCSPAAAPCCAGWTRSAASTGLPVRVAEDALSCVALGTGRCLEEMSTLRNVLHSAY